MAKKKKKSSHQSLINQILPYLVGTIILDQLTKLTILYTLAKHQVVYVFSLFNLTLTYNTGVSFGMFQSNGMLGLWLLSIIALFLCAYIIYILLQTKDPFEIKCYSLILGGAIGNLIDRFLYGGVVDFLQFHFKHHYWPTFNIADAAIVCGVILVLAKQTWHSYTQRGSKK